jgi:OTU domain-containing protein 6
LCVADHCGAVQKLEQATKKSVASAQKSGKAAKQAAVDAGEAEMAKLVASHAQQVAAKEAPESAGDDDAPGDDAGQSDAAPTATGAKPAGGLSKAARRRLAQEQAEREHEARVAHAEAHGVDWAKEETQALTAQLAPLQLAIVQIAADGNCLYAAVADQIKARNVALAGGAAASVASMRSTAADFMLAHADDYAPFLDLPDGCADANAALQRYCDTLRSSNEWGGQLELRALAAALRCVIVVHTAGAAPLRMGDDVADAPELHVAYHKKLLSLGEHYNSVRSTQ